MRNLQNKHTGHYYCAVATGEQPPIKVIYELYLKIQSTPDVSVVSSSVSGHEGGDISVQCLYSSGYQSKVKQWCRYKDQSCYTVGRTDTSQNPSVQISDDGRKSFTVLMTGLRLTDSVWYFCSAGEILNPVQPFVTHAEQGTVSEKVSETGILKNINKTEVIEEPNLTVFIKIRNNLLTVLISALATLLLLLILVGVFSWRWRRKPKQDKHQIRGRNCSTTTEAIYSKPGDPVIYSTINDEISNDPSLDITIYCTVNYGPGNEASLFTVTMRNLQNKHTAHYYCVVETGEQPPMKVIYEPYLKIQSTPDVSVVSSSVSGHEGSNISVQCLYSSGYQNKVKQWCRYKDQSCYTVGRTDTSQNPSVQISDDGKSSFTVLMTGLRLTDSGWYFCSAGEVLNPVQLTVTHAERVPDVSVVNSSVSGHKDGDISVQCLYSSGYQNKTKQWCRYKDQSCYTVGRTDTSQNSSVHIIDDGKRSFTVMTGLRLTDSGWYCCSVGDLQVPVHLMVTEPKRALTNIPATAPSDFETDMHGVTLVMFLPVMLVNLEAKKEASSVSGHEGGDISVQCLYNSGYKNKVKQWCRYKDKSCYTVRRTDTSQNPSVQISDDGRRSFTVLMTGLRLTDSGWYFCSQLLAVWLEAAVDGVPQCAVFLLSEGRNGKVAEASVYQ
ncbi:hypothetical protein Q8A67_008585 [Cirrhinus molitorella]|uniref:Ig-like domain-containing protein n=1 Tax=Cirrhinus molitorella TaxID=172907 RepID=A0AA88TQT7_9TELE|nr:hypothetical protein Q8A67_008585 [Cirrhinus molitorella]